MTAKLAAVLKTAKGLGALNVRPLPAKAVAVADWVRWRCRYGCGRYGRRLTCPPAAPGPEETRRLLAGYRSAVLVRARVCRDIRRIVPALERELFLAGYYKVFGFAAGACNLCRTCAASCRHPELARPSMEACGIDVFATVRKAGLPIGVLKDKTCEADCYGLLLVE